MAGDVRQPIDIPSLERYLNQNVPEIKTPLEVKQASLDREQWVNSNRCIQTNCGYTVQFWPVKPYLPAHCRR